MMLEKWSILEKKISKAHIFMKFIKVIKYKNKNQKEIYLPHF